MRIADSTDRLFLKNYLRDFLTLKRQALFEEIASLDEDPLLTTSLEDLCDQLVNEYTLSAPQIDESGIYSETRGPRVTEKAFFHNRVHEANSGNRVIVHIPFTGIPELFECHSLTATDVMPPRAFVRDSELAFEYQTRHVEGDGLKKAFDRDLNSLRSNLAQIAHDLEVFNSSLRESARERISARQDKLLHERQLAESLGFPAVRQATDVAPQPLAVSMDPETPQPSSEPAQFTHSPDYRSVRHQDRRFDLTATQAHVVRILHEAAALGTPDVGWEYIHVTVELGKRTRMRDLFKNLDGWGTLIVTGGTKGTWRLNL